MLNKFEEIQKSCIKWILSEEYIRYNSIDTYKQKCKTVNLLPLASRFDLNDLILFYKIVYNIIPIKLPDYLSFFDGSTRLRSSHLDNLSLVCNLPSRKFSMTSLILLNKSFYFRTHTIWNA